MIEKLEDVAFAISHTQQFRLGKILRHFLEIVDGAQPAIGFLLFDGPVLIRKAVRTTRRWSAALRCYQGITVDFLDRFTRPPTAW
jgi:hypothetical protein